MKQVITTEHVPIKLWLDDIDETALTQAKNLANLPFAYKWIAVMPDCHTGFGMPIGGVLAAQEVIVPNAVGVDIGCGMLAVRTDLLEITPAALHEIIAQIKQVIPVGFKHHLTDQPWSGLDRAPDVGVIQKELASARRQLGTLGGGNHFIEIQHGSDGHIWLMIHSGSRNFGLQTATFFHKRAVVSCEKGKVHLPDRDLSFLSMDTQDGRDYFLAMRYCCDFARANRALMMEKTLEILARVTRGRQLEAIDIHHNYADLEDHYRRAVLVHRKGATKASMDMVGIIPGSMGTRSYIVRGLGNPESFESCSHGAGRRMGRKEAIRSLKLEEEQKKLTGILNGLHSRGGLDEAPGAYKDIDVVMRNQKDLVEVTIALTPLASIKG